MDYLTVLEADYRRLVQVTSGDLTARVPTCPEWTVDDLVNHVAHVYLHKAAVMRLNAMPRPWPPAPTGETPSQLLQRGYAEMSAEFVARAGESAAATWFEPDQTVGFWRRRMAQETVIHRIDAELAMGVPSEPIPADLALDGIDEVLRIMLAWASRRWPDKFTAELSKGDGSVLVIDRWLVSWNSSGVSISDEGTEIGDGDVSGSAEAVLRWLWRRADDSAVQLAGDSAKVRQMQELLRVATQ
ncbi:hypothetical protein Rhe02_94280 [Rhizocola hellebori]|uniref:Maleylpyruvate isomerase family mycothiol-dependent enzyme n=1 Tax=Rhizocola hellebori TaxID=1392758 RepID=A0A8J3QLR5_9ACTN|nr:maleylpyruvate isomerase family mycothiol-dependent enzyme [Rhizocola hellebori]GIH11361.1 hypothetical protein Rhe02_94280 [Rhizocola hellebori]